MLNRNAASSAFPARNCLIGLTGICSFSCPEEKMWGASLCCMDADEYGDQKRKEDQTASSQFYAFDENSLKMRAFGSDVSNPGCEQFAEGGLTDEDTFTAAAADAKGKDEQHPWAAPQPVAKPSLTI
jgi:hypothetical protein